MSSIDLPPPATVRPKVAQATPPQVQTPPPDAMTARPVPAADKTAEPRLDPRGLQRPDETLLFRARSLALARDEERRLEQRLSDLRHSIEATEQALRRMQSDAPGPGA